MREKEGDTVDELVKLVVQKTGLPEATARTVVGMVIDYLKKKLPAPVGGQIDAVLKGGGLGDVAKGLGGILKK
jgi:hypothetical protein